MVQINRLEDHIGLWLRLSSNHVSHAFARKLESKDVTVAEWVVLRTIHGLKAPISPNQVADATGLTRGAVSKLVDRLVEKNLASKTTAQDDQRYQKLALTPPGKLLVPQLARLADQNDEEFFGALSAQERRELRRILQKLAQAHDLRRLPIS